MEPFAAKSTRGPNLHWWAIAGVAGAYFIWSFNLLPRLRTVATGRIAPESRQIESASIRAGSADHPLDTDWNPQIFEPSTPRHYAEGLLETDDPVNRMLNGGSADSGLNHTTHATRTPRSADSRTPQPRSSPYHDSEIAEASWNTTEITPGIRRSANQTPDTTGTGVTTAAATRVSPTESQRPPMPSTEPSSIDRLAPVIPSDVADKLRLVEEWLEEDHLLDAHAELSSIYWKHPQLRSVILEQLERTATLIFSTNERHFGPTHFVEFGQTLEAIGREYNVPWEYLAMLNRVTPEKLQAGRELKVVRGPFGAVVDLHAFTLTVHAHGWYVNHYPIGTGKDAKTPTGRFTVQNKLENPTWYNPDGGVVDGDDPSNPLGEYWIGLGNQIGIHGTNDPSTIGRAASRGCIHLDDDDIAEVYRLLSPGSEVLIRR